MRSSLGKNQSHWQEVHIDCIPNHSENRKFLGNFACFCCRLLTFFKINLFKKFFQEHYQSVKQFGSRSGTMLCRCWSGSKLLARVISRRRKSLLTRNDGRDTLETDNNWAVTCDFQQCGILTSEDSEEPVQPPFKLRNSKWCSVSILTVIEYSSDEQRLWSDCAYAQVQMSAARRSWRRFFRAPKTHV